MLALGSNKICIVQRYAAQNSAFSLFFLVCCHGECSPERKRALGGWVVARNGHGFSMLFKRITLTDSLQVAEVLSGCMTQNSFLHTKTVTVENQNVVIIE